MNTMTNKKVEFVLREFDTSSGRGKWSRNKRGTLNDQIIFLTLKTTNSDTLIASWQVQLFTTSNTQSDTSLPIPGDVLTIKLTKPFLVDNVFEFTMPDIPAGVSDQDRTSLPQYFSLSQNYPNPFNPTTTVLFSLPIKSKVHLYLIDILGRIVKEITNGNYSAGNHNVTIDASKLASGIYFCRLETNTGFVQTKKLVLIK
jgi:hypothetical protein